MISKPIIILILAIIFVLLLILGIYKTTPNYILNSNTQIINIGVPLALTGKMASFGDKIKNGFDLAAEEINVQSKIKINLIYEDTKGDNKEAINIVQNFIDTKNIKIISGLVLSSEVLAVMPIINEKQVLLFNTISSSDEISKEDFVFRTRETSRIHAKQALDFFIDKNINNILILAANATNGLSYANNFLVYCKDKNIICNLENYNSDEKEFSSLITKLKDKKYKNIYLSATSGQDGSQIVKQMIENNYFPLILGTPVLDSKEFYDLTKDYNNLYITLPDFNYENKIANDFIAKYKLKYNEDPSIFSANAYDAIYLIKDAVIFCNSFENTQCIKNYLLTVNYEGVEGKIRFDENGDVVKKVVIKNLKDGKFVN